MSSAAYFAWRFIKVVSSAENFYLLFFFFIFHREMSRHFMGIDSHEMSSFIFSEKMKWK